ncbi:unnamed protein product [Bursaphelenchus okinawaensis]|uniref:receptor protein-tyrosine kinase n=1 Tax=Bursaphelenchus okinawaensis TaxID=465554 RepID=A0A811JRC3_9BILA|nr:unnamed protein product [Bursaphelenchus okinawaensis]CAG9079639.1 unnamed protein product [Bursaphelenchus okinawaensis]
MITKLLLTLLIHLVYGSNNLLYKDGDTYLLPAQRKWTVNDQEVCLGTSNGRTAAGALVNETRYEMLLKSFVRCKRIIGNLEISHISQRDLIFDVDIRRLPNGTEVQTRRTPFWFLHDLEEITGYLLLYNVEVKEISFPALKIIWGDKLHDGNSLQLDSNPFLKVVNLPQLREIHQGKILIRRSPRLCFFRQTVDFSELLGSDYQQRLVFVDENAPDCAGELVCHSQCNGNCFGPTEKECQTVYRRQCLGCSSGQCYQDKANNTHCCDEACLGGCYGDGKDQCVACLNYEEDGRCVTECRGTSRYNSALMIMQPMPDSEKRYYYEKHCVQQCPAGTLIEDRYCVARCSEGKYRDPSGDERHCVPCDGTCPKVCTLNEPINSHNIKQLVNCSEIEGNIEVLNHVFSPHLPLLKSHQMDKNRPVLIEPLKLEDLNMLKTVKIVTGHVALDGGVKRGADGPRSLDFLESLEVIEGRTLYFKKYSIYAIGNDYLQSLGLNSLRKVANGGVSLTKNKNLCYGQGIPFKKLYGIKDIVIKENMNNQTCEHLGRVCDSTCHPEYGCWGPGPAQCVKCLNFTKDGYCSETCPTHDGYFIPRQNRAECKPCADECLRCNGPTDSDCTRCRWFEMPKTVGNKMKCVRQCPADTYQESHQCKKCNPACYEYGCTGNGTFLGMGGCNKCLFAVRNGKGINCLMGESEETVCKNNGYEDHHLSLASTKDKNTKFMCEKCPEECSSCSRATTLANDCECAKFTLITPLSYMLNGSDLMDFPDECTLTCGQGSRLLENSNNGTGQICERCHELCDPEFSCFGSTEFECEQCRIGGIYTDDDTIECLPACPDDLPYPYLGVCRAEDTEAILARRRKLIIGVVAAAFILASVIILILVSRCVKYRKKYEKEAMMHMPEIPELDTNKRTQRPNMGRFTLISTDELDDTGRNILGQGAFGIVYAGKWTPPGRNTSIPVAIKAINPAETKNVTENEMLKEAGVMGKVRHEHLLPLVGVCFAKSGIKIITILRPLGSLLKFLQQYKQRLGAKQLVLYQYQISSAMEFLARKKIVHRDLAARNVLVKNINHVEVTDFGLAQLLQNNENTVVIKEGRVAVKWLALESLRSHVFNERTDVWAFGVTCWEILTFGEPPYRELQAILQPITTNYNFATEFANLLERGHRLKQPFNCSQELYEQLLNCWLNDAESRPTFRQLKEKFESFARAPHLYVQDRQAVSQMESISDKEQRSMIEQMLQDSDFENPLELDPTDYGPIRRGRSENTEETFLPDTPTSSQFGHRNPFGDRSISMNSTMPRTSESQREDSYLQPKCALEPTENGTVYTPVIVNSSDSPSHEYLNDPYQKLLQSNNHNGNVETAF